jgi:protoporphyrin/coproporphyrin ferrochelatase
MTPRNWGVMLLAHGTVSDLGDLPGFLTRIRRGRPPSEALVLEMRHRYEAIGGSPLLALSERQAEALARRLGRPCVAAMRLSSPEPNEVFPRLSQLGVDTVCLLPLAPFSVSVYIEAAREVLPPGTELRGVPPWGSHPAFIEAHVVRIGPHLRREPGEVVVLTAHSLPRRVIEMGDPYARQFEACAELVGKALGAPFRVAYQSQGADGDDWLGPDLLGVIEQEKAAGARRVVIAPIGFVAEHVETLYDLDIEARKHTEALGLEFARPPALDDAPEFIEALAQIAETTMEENA